MPEKRTLLPVNSVVAAPIANSPATLVSTLAAIASHLERLLMCCCQFFCVAPTIVPHLAASGVPQASPLLHYRKRYAADQQKGCHLSPAGGGCKPSLRCLVPPLGPLSQTL